MGKMKFIVFSLVISFFTACINQNINAEEVRNTCVNTKNANLSGYFSEPHIENDNNIHEETYNTRIMIENIILKCSLVITVILFVTYLLFRKNKTLKSQEVFDYESTIDSVTVNNEYNDINTADIHNEAINMFRNIDKTMREKKPYLNTDFSRDTMIRMFNTNKNKLNEAIIAGSGMSYSKYICELRLQESIKILEEDSNILLNDLAMRCGFNTYSSFYRSFYKRFGMNPADYKQEYIKENAILDNH